jgi:hypothetical protein
MDREKQIDRLIRNSLSDFRMKITDAFFKYYDALKEGVGDKEDEEKLLAWSDFSKQVDQLWNQAWPDLVSLASQPTIDMHRVKDRLARFKIAAQKKWDDLRSALGIKAGSSEQLPEKLEKLELDPRTEHLMRTMMPKRKYTMADRTKVYETYNKALDGRAAIYEELFADWKAVWRGERKLFANTRAWWAGHGLLFADTRAWWAGKRPLFATLRAWLYKNALPPLPEPLKTQDIMEALAQHNEKDVQHFVREMDVPQFLEPLKGDILLSFKIQLVEAVLDFAHDRITKGQRITHKDMDDMKAVLSAVKAEQSTSQQQLVSSVTQKLQHTTVRFFGRSLKPELKKIIDQRQQEHELDTAAVNQGQLGWQGFDLGSIAPAV